MKILFLMNHVIMGGLEKVLLEYTGALSAQGVSVTVFSRDKVTDPYFLHFFQSHKIKLIDLHQHQRHFFIHKIIAGCIMFVKLRHYINACDVIVDFANFSFVKYLQNVNKQKIGFCHGSILFFNSHIDKKVLNVYDDIVCLSDSFKRDFIKQYPLYKDKIHRIYNPINISRVRELSNDKISMKRPYFVAVQRLNAVDKDVATIINAFNIFNERHPEYYLYIVGDGPQKEELEQLAHVNSHIIFVGKIDNPYPFIKYARALVLSSTTTVGEGLPNTLLEAQSIGTLAISSDVKSGPAEILMNGRAGVLFNPGDANDLASKFSYVADGKWDVSKITKYAAAHLDRFDVKQNVQSFLDLIKGIK